MRRKAVLIMLIFGIAYVCMLYLGTSPNESINPKIFGNISICSKINLIAVRRVGRYGLYEMGLVDHKGNWEKTLFISRDPIKSVLYENRSREILFTKNMNNLSGTEIWKFRFDTSKSIRIAKFNNYSIILDGFSSNSGNILGWFSSIVDTRSVFVGRTLRHPELRSMHLEDGKLVFTQSFKIVTHGYDVHAHWLGKDPIVICNDSQKNEAEFINSSGRTMLISSGNFKFLNSTESDAVYVAQEASENMIVYLFDNFKLKKIKKIPNFRRSFVIVTSTNIRAVSDIEYCEKML